MKKYNIIYADPPWTFKTYSEKGKGRSAERHYECMSLEEIKALPIQNICADDCMLFMWVTFPMLEHGLEVINDWGFTYKGLAFNWFKRNRKANTFFWGMGYYTRANSEVCLLATKGKPKRVARNVHSVIEMDEYIDTKIEGHSKKPDEARDKIIQLCGDLPRIELFAREKVDGWDSIGYEVNGIEVKEFLNKRG